MTRKGWGRPHLPLRAPSGRRVPEERGDIALSQSLQVQNVSHSGSRISGGAVAGSNEAEEETPLLQSGSALDSTGTIESNSALEYEAENFVSSRNALPRIFHRLSDSLLPKENEYVDDSSSSTDSHGGSFTLTHPAESTRSENLFCDSSEGSNRGRLVKRSFRRRIFLILTEPQSSIASVAFFFILIFSIALSNILMMLQTMESFQFTPKECHMCGGSNDYYSTNDDAIDYGPVLMSVSENAAVSLCQCPPVPLPSIVKVSDYIIFFFTIEWILRFVCFEPVLSDRCTGLLSQRLSYLFEWSTMLDALAIFPYYLERFSKTRGLLALRLLRLFRAFQLLRLGKYNTTFVSLINVLTDSILSLNILLIVLLFGAAFFGSMIYWLEKGEWQYIQNMDPPSFAYARPGIDGSMEPSPFTSIPASFWWFLVTATTVGYGDFYPVTVGGKCVAGVAAVMSVLVVAFPVSVFSDLWSKELKKRGVIETSHSDTDSATENAGAAGSNIRNRHLYVVSNSNGSDTTTAAMDSADIRAIKAHLRSVDEAQRAIWAILGKNEL